MPMVRSVWLGEDGSYLIVRSDGAKSSRSGVEMQAEYATLAVAIVDPKAQPDPKAPVKSEEQMKAEHDANTQEQCRDDLGDGVKIVFAYDKTGRVVSLSAVGA